MAPRGGALAAEAAGTGDSGRGSETGELGGFFETTPRPPRGFDSLLTKREHLVKYRIRPVTFLRQQKEISYTPC